MRKVQIFRNCFRSDGVFGVLAVDGFPICVTLERPWLNNAKGQSCVPAGSYIARAVLSPKFGKTFEITGVTNRSEILFHAGNIDDDSHGCVLLGESFAIWKDGSCCIQSSKVAFMEFWLMLQSEKEFEVEILNFSKES